MKPAHHPVDPAPLPATPCEAPRHTARRRALVAVVLPVMVGLFLLPLAARAHHDQAGVTFRSLRR
jgi:hypothetical protein